MKAIKEMTSSELFTEMTEQQRDDIYRMVWFGHIEDDTASYIRDNYAEEEIHEDDINGIAESVANAWVYNGDYDCNLSYWSNIYNLIEENK